MSAGASLMGGGSDERSDIGRGVRWKQEDIAARDTNTIMGERATDDQMPDTGKVRCQGRTQLRVTPTRNPPDTGHHKSQVPGVEAAAGNTRT